MSFNKFKNIDFNSIEFWMVPAVEVLTNWLSEVRFGNITEMFNHAFFEFTLGLAHIQHIAVSAFQAVYQITAAACEIFAALV